MLNRVLVLTATVIAAINRDIIPMTNAAAVPSSDTPLAELEPPHALCDPNDRDCFTLPIQPEVVDATQPGESALNYYQTGLQQLNSINIASSYRTQLTQAEAALENFSKAAVLDPANENYDKWQHKAMSECGYLYFQIGRTEPGTIATKRDLLHKSANHLKTLPADAPANVNKLFVSRAPGFAESGVRNIREASKMNDGAERTKLLNEAREDFQAALDDYNQLILKYPNNLLYHVKRAQVYSLLGERHSYVISGNMNPKEYQSKFNTAVKTIHHALAEHDKLPINSRFVFEIALGKASCYYKLGMLYGRNAKRNATENEASIATGKDYCKQALSIYQELSKALLPDDLKKDIAEKIEDCKQVEAGTLSYERMTACIKYLSLGLFLSVAYYTTQKLRESATKPEEHIEAEEPPKPKKTKSTSTPNPNPKRSSRAQRSRYRLKASAPAPTEAGASEEVSHAPDTTERSAVADAGNQSPKVATGEHAPASSTQSTSHLTKSRRKEMRLARRKRREKLKVGAIETDEDSASEDEVATPTTASPTATRDKSPTTLRPPVGAVDKQAQLYAQRHEAQQAVLKKLRPKLTDEHKATTMEKLKAAIAQVEARLFKSSAPSTAESIEPASAATTIPLLSSTRLVRIADRTAAASAPDTKTAPAASASTSTTGTMSAAGAASTSTASMMTVLSGTKAGDSKEENSEGLLPVPDAFKQIARTFCKMQAETQEKFYLCGGAARQFVRVTHKKISEDAIHLDDIDALTSGDYKQLSPEFYRQCGYALKENTSINNKHLPHKTYSDLFIESKKTMTFCHNPKVKNGVNIEEANERDLTISSVFIEFCGNDKDGYQAIIHDPSKLGIIHLLQNPPVAAFTGDNETILKKLTQDPIQIIRIFYLATKLNAMIPQKDLALIDQVINAQPTLFAAHEDVIQNHWIKKKVQILPPPKQKSFIDQLILHKVHTAFGNALRKKVNKLRKGFEPGEPTTAVSTAGPAVVVRRKRS